MASTNAFHPHKRIGRLVWNTEVVDLNTLSNGEKDVVEYWLKVDTVSNVELWRNDDDDVNPGKLAVQICDDGLYMTGYFDFDGNLIGDWIV